MRKYLVALLAMAFMLAAPMAWSSVPDDQAQSGTVLAQAEEQDAETGAYGETEEEKKRRKDKEDKEDEDVEEE